MTDDAISSLTSFSACKQDAFENIISDKSISSVIDIGAKAFITTSTVTEPCNTISNETVGSVSGLGSMEIFGPASDLVSEQDTLLKSIMVEMEKEEHRLENIIDPDQWKALSPFEKKMYQNQYNNNLFQKLMGLKVPAVDFLQKNGRFGRQWNKFKAPKTITKSAKSYCDNDTNLLNNTLNRGTCKIPSTSTLQIVPTMDIALNSTSTNTIIDTDAIRIKTEPMDTGYEQVNYDPNKKVKTEIVDIKCVIKTKVKQEILDGIKIDKTPFAIFQQMLKTRVFNPSCNRAELIKDLTDAFLMKLITVKDVMRFAPKDLDLRKKILKDLGNKKILKKSKVPAQTRYPKRARQEVNYQELLDTDFIDCLECGEEHAYGECPEHGRLQLIEDARVPDKLEGKRRRNLAAFTTPDVVRIGPSRIKDAGSGVFTVKPIKKGDTFGPYKGDLVYSELDAHESGYAWEIFVDGVLDHYIDGKNLKTSNWMRFVNCSNSREGQHLEAIQIKQNIYYRAVKDVDVDEELLVFYGYEYLEEMEQEMDMNQNQGSVNQLEDLDYSKKKKVPTATLR